MKKKRFTISMNSEEFLEQVLNLKKPIFRKWGRKNIHAYVVYLRVSILISLENCVILLTSNMYRYLFLRGGDSFGKEIVNLKKFVAVMASNIPKQHMYQIH